ncbi:MAG: cysteine--tRNA ligase [Candidatus ainarchaeum sp.]|nr:cysteine--tRNA ligase [Candidatus ainarchaeum sp.]
MHFKIHNSLGNKLEKFKPIKNGQVGLYTCGPTVYNFAHIGNFRAYCWEDILKRYLIFLGFKVNHVMNLTDIDDKTIKGSIREKTTLSEFTQKYKDAFFEDIKTLNILPADFYPEATQHIPEMIQIIDKLLKNNMAYKSEDNCIYFSIKNFPTYGKLSNINIKKLKSGARIKQDEYEKDGIGDFALWKAWDEDDGTIFWETKFGKGRPGWHLECSAMSSKYLGETFDLHTGGVDNKFPHHENEIAQSEGANKKKFVNYWMHCEHLMVNGKKMSKSLGNFYTLRDLIEKKMNPLAIRYVLINSQYRQPLNFTLDGIEDAQKTLIGLQRFLERLREIEKLKENDSINEFVIQTTNNFSSAMNNDLNVPQATKHLFEFVRKINKLIDDDDLGKIGANQAINFLKHIDSVLGIIDFTEAFFELNDEQEELLKQRELARKNKDWKTADTLRNELLKQGIEIIDQKDGSTKTKQTKN